MGSAPFRYCLNTSTIRCGEVRLEEAIAVTAKAGYDGIEPWVKELDDYVAAGGDLRDLDRRIHDAGLQVANLIGFFGWALPDDDQRRQAFAEARRCFELARLLHCPYVAAPPMHIHEMPGLDLRAIAERYAQLIDVARDYGVVPVLEFWGVAKTLGRLGEALLVAAESGRAEACILADVFHIYKSGGSFAALELLGPRTLGLFHVNDYPASPARATITDAERVYPGDGVAPLGAIFASLRRAGFQGMLSLELFNGAYWRQDALTVARTGLEKLKQATDG